MSLPPITTAVASAGVPKPKAWTMAIAQQFNIPGSHFTFLEGSLLTVARNKLAKRFMESGHKYLLFVDDDTVLPQSAAAQLVTTAESKGAGIVCGVVPLMPDDPKCGAPILNVEIDREKLKPWPVGQFEIHRGGTACMLIRRDVFEAVEYPWFVADDRTGEDYRFCDRARAAGFSIWCDAEVRCDHLKIIGLMALCPPPPK